MSKYRQKKYKLDMSDLTMTVALPKVLVFRLKLAFYIMNFASIVGGFHFVVEEDEEVCP